MPDEVEEGDDDDDEELIEEEEEEDEDPDKENPLRNRFYDKDVRGTRVITGLTYFTRQLASTVLIGAQNTFNFVGPFGIFRTNTEPGNPDEFYASLAILRGITGSDDLQLPTMMDMNVMYMKAPRTLPIDLFIGLNFENQYFINIEQGGQLNRLGQNTILWLKGGAEFRYPLFGRAFINQIFLSRTFYANTDFYSGEEVPLSGFKFEVATRFRVYKKFYFGARIISQTVSSSAKENLLIEQTTTYFSGFYRF